MATAMEYSARIEIPGFPSTGENELGFELVRWLDEHTDMGPVMSGPGPGDRACASLGLATDAPDEATAAREMVDAAARGLEAIGLGHLYPARIELEIASDGQQLDG